MAAPAHMDWSKIIMAIIALIGILAAKGCPVTVNCLGCVSTPEQITASDVKPTGSAVKPSSGSNNTQSVTDQDMLRRCKTFVFYPPPPYIRQGKIPDDIKQDPVKLSAAQSIIIEKQIKYIETARNLTETEINRFRTTCY